MNHAPSENDQIVTNEHHIVPNEPLEEKNDHGNQPEVLAAIEPSHNEHVANSLPDTLPEPESVDEKNELEIHHAISAIESSVDDGATPIEIVAAISPAEDNLPQPESLEENKEPERSHSPLVVEKSPDNQAQPAPVAKSISPEPNSYDREIAEEKSDLEDTRHSISPAKPLEKSPKKPSVAKSWMSCFGRGCTGSKQQPSPVRDESPNLQSPRASRSS